MSDQFHPVMFTLDDAERAYKSWGCNCGPGALAAIGGVTLDEARDWLGREEFDRKRYTNPTMMAVALGRSGLRFASVKPLAWPEHGIVRVQWEGPWTAPGANPKWAYRQTHWVGSFERGDAIFDINAISSGGWISRLEWSEVIVPLLLRTCVPRANGKWHITHAIEVRRRW